MQHTVCENLLETNPREGSDWATQQDNKPRLALRIKSDCSRKLRLATQLTRPSTIVRGDITKRKLPIKTRKKVQTAVIQPSGGNTPTIIGKRLLSDIIEIMRHKNRSKMRSKHLLVHLCSNPKKPWATFCRGGRNLNFRQLSALLREFGICSKDMRFNSKSFKGFQMEWFIDAAAKRRSEDRKK
jgi:hypothetical protein